MTAVRASGSKDGAGTCSSPIASVRGGKAETIDAISQVKSIPTNGTNGAYRNSATPQWSKDFNENSKIIAG
ncbi:UNVERIFIED_CONTAM: hypothetical protein Sindi_1655300, partial [Sesamum indicum]